MEMRYHLGPALVSTTPYSSCKYEYVYEFAVTFWIFYTVSCHRMLLISVMLVH